MVNPGTLPLSIVRGIAFEGLVLQCKDENVLVSGTLTPDATGVYVPCGTFAGFDLFVLAGSPTFFLYFNPIAGTYVISQTLTTAALLNAWIPDIPLNEPTGSYKPVGSVLGTASANDNPTDLTGFTAEARVKRTSKADVLLDLQPTVTNAAIGEITIPPISKTDTEALEFTGNFNWDLVIVQTSTGERFGPYVKGPFPVTDNITQIIPP